MSPEAKKALANRIVLLGGEEEYLRRQLLAEIVAEATGGDDFDIESFEGGVDSPEAWFGSAGTAPFLSTRRVAVVRRLLRVEPPDSLPKELPETALVILVPDEELGDDSKQRRLAKFKRGWDSAVVAAGGAVVTVKESSNPVEVVRNAAGAKGKKLSPTAASTLVEMSGGSLSRCLEELEKLIVYAGDSEQIREEDVREVALPSREWNIFKLVDAITGNQVPEALRHIRILLGSSQKMEEAAQRNILPQLSRQFRLIWQARQCIEARATLASIPSEISSTFPDKPNLLKEKDFVQRKVFGIARNITFGQLAECFRLLSDADARIKGLLPAYSPFETLETALLKMVEVCHPATVRR